jgi:UDP-N-acetylglucosamine--N-acetylmuramyl-(pentapeptide) pyrophosphoryl-undecaprenol N-acetylglucosamine transferase
MQVVLAGGGTAGHVEPALAVADALRRRDPSVGVVALGTERGLETRLVPQRGYDLALIPAVPLPRRLTPTLLTVPQRLQGAVREAERILEQVEADVVIGFGGYVALPAYFAARRRRVPIVVHEANARPGLANRLGARWAARVAGSSPDLRLPGAEYVGIPLRVSISTLNRPSLREEAREHFGLQPDAPTLLVFGGSQGAQSLNAAVSGALSQLRAAGVQVLHAVGPRQEQVESLTGNGAPYVALSYVDRMDLAYAAADLALCRAGAMTCAELAAVGLPGVYVPLPHGNGEQRLNARPVVEAGGGLLVDDADLTAEWLIDEVLPRLKDRATLAAMGEAAAAFGRRDADEKLVDMVLAAVQQSGQAGGEHR